MSSETRPAGATNGDGAPRQRRARTSKPKVKTGCSSCKQRRIKCDERRPACANCVRAKKICPGYPAPPRRAGAYEVWIAPKEVVASAPPPVHAPVSLPPRRANRQRLRGATPSATNLSLAPRAVLQTPLPQLPLLHTPAVHLPFDTEEGLYFQLFRQQTASELSGFFDLGFWARTVLQECHSEASIRHAVVALGALYKTLEKSTESPPGSPSRDDDPADNAWRHWEMAVKQYSRACQELVSANAADTRSNRTRLMASVLLACFDSFIGDHRQAIRQIQNGLALLEQLRVQKRRAFLPKPEEPVEEELIQIFTRLAIQAKSYDMAFHFPHPFVVRLTASTAQSQDPGSPSSEAASPVSLYQDPIPEQFSSVLEARLRWDALAEKLFRYIESMLIQTQSSVMGILPQSTRQHGLLFGQEIDAWSAAFEHILTSRTAPGVTSQEKACIAVLKMYQVMSQIIYLMTFTPNESGFDDYLNGFKMIVDLALEVVGDEERRAALKRCPDPEHCWHRGRHDSEPFVGQNYTARHIKPSFSADLGIVPPLFVVATKCRDHTTRWKAIQLLQSSPRREGMWDSEMTARIGMWVAEIEEGGDDTSYMRSPTPGDNRSSPTPSYPSPRPSTSGSSVRTNGTSLDFGNGLLGPGGNAKWDDRRGSFGAVQLPGRSPQLPQRAAPIPEERRVMVRAVEFDLRERFAIVQLGSRELSIGTPDLKTRVKKIMW